MRKSIFKAIPRDKKSFPVPCQTRSSLYLADLVFSVRTVSDGSLFFPLRLMARELRGTESKMEEFRRYN